MSGIAALQPYLVAFFLCWAALLKLLRPRARGTAVERLVGPARAVPALRLVAAVELAVAVPLVAFSVTAVSGTATPALAVLRTAEIGAAALFTGFLGYLTYARTAAPTSSCGCLGSHARPVDWRSFARTGLLLAMSVVAMAAPPQPVDLPLVGLGVVEALVLIALSPELDRHWLSPLRRLRVRVLRPLAVLEERDVPLETSLRLLYRSPAYCSAAELIISDVREAWVEDGVRFVVYAARGGTAVFSVPLGADDPSKVRVATV